ncbi:MAG: BamA/TamA family outer membrane protein [Chlorobi bacterium]|nr:BamA/TamA family outer membrane protein [Chlorobiota bacterium]
MKKFTFLLMSLFAVSLIFAQETETKEKIKTGFSMGALPVIAYDADTGFKYGALANFYLYGDGSNYPNYNHSLYMEWSRTTKGSGVNLLTYDGLTLIPKTRVTFELGYLTEQALNFYGFNGYNAYYNPSFEIEDSTDYISRVYYRHARDLFKIKADFQGNITESLGKKLRWLLGAAYYNTDVYTVDIDRLNEGETEDLLPDTALLYDKYVEWGVIPDDQKDGGNVALLKMGVVYDTRDNEANPNKGMWSEVLLQTAPGFLGNDYSYSRLLISHRQYISLFPDKLTFAYRLSWQTKVGGDIPFYMLPYTIDSKADNSGLGGAKNLRGILRNRVVGDGMAFANFELRSKFLKTVILNQNFYLGLNVFTDMGIVTSSYSFDTSGVPASELETFDYQDESLHVSYGGGVRFVLNSNFIVSVDYGIAAKAEDGTSGLYIGLNYLF